MLRERELLRWKFRNSTLTRVRQGRQRTAPSEPTFPSSAQGSSAQYRRALPSLLRIIASNTPIGCGTFSSVALCAAASLSLCQQLRRVSLSRVWQRCDVPGERCIARACPRRAGSSSGSSSSDCDASAAGGVGHVVVRLPRRLPNHRPGKIFARRGQLVEATNVTTEQSLSGTAYIFSRILAEWTRSSTSGTALGARYSR